MALHVVARTWLVGLAALMGLAMAGMAPEPDPVPRRWQLDIEVGALRIASVDVPNVGPRNYFYLTYKVVNNTGEDLLFAPGFELATDEGELLRSGRDVPVDVTREIMGRLDNSLIEDQISIIGQILQGEEHAKEGLVVWPANDLTIDEIRVYATGFSGETKVVVAPMSKRQIVLRKTLNLRYAVTGSLEQRRGKPIDLAERRWILR